MDSVETVTNPARTNGHVTPAQTPVAVVQAKMTPELKAAAEHVFHRLGLTPAEAIRVFYRQVELHQGLPFELKIPASCPAPQPSGLAEPETSPKEADPLEEIDDLGANDHIDALFSNL